MDLKSIREHKNEDLAKREHEIREEIFRIRCVAEGMTPQKGRDMRALRHELARIKTVITERETKGLNA